MIIVVLKLDGVTPPTLFFFPVLAILGPFPLHINFGVILSNLWTDLVGTWLALHWDLKNWHLNNFESSNTQIQNISPFIYIILDVLFKIFFSLLDNLYCSIIKLTDSAFGISILLLSHSVKFYFEILYFPYKSSYLHLVFIFSSSAEISYIFIN